MLTQVKTIKIGKIELEGLIADNKEYIAVIQLNKFFKFANSNKRSSDYIKKLIGKKYSFVKLQTPLHNRSINVLPVEAFNLILEKLATQENPIALKLKENWLTKLINKLRSLFENIKTGN